MALALCLELEPKLSLQALDALPSLLQVSRSIQALLLPMLAELREIRVPAENVCCLLAEVLAKRSPRLEAIQIGHRGLTCAVRGLGREPWLPTSFLTPVEATMMAPHLRRNANFRGFTRRKHNPPHFEMRVDLDKLKRPRGRMIWSNVADDMPDAVESIFMMSLVGPPAAGWGGRRKASIEWSTLEPCMEVRRAMRVASKRTGVTIDWHRPVVMQSMVSKDCMFFICCFVFALLPMIWLRLCEDAYARETGYPGALMSMHPLKVMTFSERLQTGQLLTNGKTEL